MKERKREEEEEGGIMHWGALPLLMGQAGEKGDKLKGKVEQMSMHQCVFAGGGRVARRDTHLPMVGAGRRPHQVLSSSSAAPKHPSHPITTDAGLPKRAGRA